jgi:Flp pilus assembly protein TadG
VGCRSPRSLLRSGRDESGQVFALVAISLVVLLAMTGLVLDVGHAYFVQRALQADADAAATAGATELPNAGVAVATAQSYSGSVGGKNERANVTEVATTATTKCLAQAPCNPVNAIVVRQSTQVKTFFARVVGIDSINVSARATACSPCSARPLDIMLVLDRTGSMCWDHYGVPDPSCTDLNNARAGILTFLRFMDPTLVRIGLAAFPPATSPDTICSKPPDLSSYNSRSSVYVVSPLSTDYLVDGELNPTSTLVSTLGCLVGSGGTSYATAIEVAQEELDAHGRGDVQDVIIFLSDGAANYGPDYYSDTSPYRMQPCHQAISSAAGVKARGTLVYTIGYDLDALDGGANVCQAYTGPLEQPEISAYSTLQEIATAPENFYNKPGPGELKTIFTQIASDVSGTRLINDDDS